MHAHTTKITTSNYSARPQSIQVYTPGFRNVLSVPPHAIRHMPPANLNVTRLVLCQNYDAAFPDTSCSMGNRCKFVHADISAAREHAIHVNYAWRSLEAVTYERFPAGQVLHVAPPNSKTASDIMDSDLALKSKALSSTRRPLSHCAHYYFNRTCNLGAECQFVHAVFIDPTAKDHQRAPVPSQLGEGRELQLSKKQREQRLREGLPVSPLDSAIPTPAAIATPRYASSGSFPRTATATAATVQCECNCNCGCCAFVEELSATVQHPMPREATLYSVATAATPAHSTRTTPNHHQDDATPLFHNNDSCSSLESSQHATPRRVVGDASSASPLSSLSGSLVVVSSAGRYRHNPYASVSRALVA